jgi:hypothetical protein
MRHVNRPWTSLWAAAAIGGLLCCPSFGRAAPQTAGADAPPGDIVTGMWQHHKATFNYVGFTTAYTCDGLGDRVRQILVHLGARKDLKVTASGCPGPYTPSHSAWVSADFDTIAPAGGATGAGTVNARWTALEVKPRRPFFMGDGDCELMQSMKDFITKNFMLRDVDYRTDCVPNQLTLDAFGFKAQGLIAAPPKPDPGKG